jgi:hypothetical protein
MALMRHLKKDAEALGGTSIYTWWFPEKMQKIFERLFGHKTIDYDISGLLGLIMFAGIGEFESENLFFSEEVIAKLFLSTENKNRVNMFSESQQNLSCLLFGITLDDVSKMEISRFENQILTNCSFQRTRFSEKLRECCVNGKGFSNSVLRKSSQKPTHQVLKLLRFIAVEVLFRLSMMFLTTNSEQLYRQMAANPQEIDEKYVGRHKMKMANLLKLYPQANVGSPALDSTEQFRQFEKWIGHDLLVSSTMALGKYTKMKLFATGIPRQQWAEFGNEEEKHERPRPSLTTPFPKHPLFKTKSATVETKKKKKVQAIGKLFANVFMDFRLS